MYFFFLASYDYTNDRNFYLETLDYGNGDSVQYEYDQQGRVTKQTYEDASYVTYDYDNSGALATVYDSETGISTTYYYDLIDRMMKYVESGNGYSHSVGYEYDTINNLTQMVETINGVKRTTSYGYDDDNRVTSITNDLTPDVAGDGITESYTYDAFGRITTKVTKNGDTTILTETYTYKPGPNGTLTSQIATYKTESANYSVTYTYNYDVNGNITSVSDGTYTTTYAYDSANQLIQENNQQAGKTYTWTYDNAGNIQSKKTYAYTTGTVGAASDTVNYSYDESQWRDLLTAYDGTAITYDQIGNPLSDGTWSYTWKQGRQLDTLSDGASTWTNTYNADGLRTKRTNGTSTYSYVYNGSQLVQMTVDGNTLLFTYDASGTPQTVTYNGTTYFYATNLQGDITAILNASGETVVSYTYDAWGNHTSGNNGTGTDASTLGKHNPLRYRGYVYDVESELYYLQSRYYNPEMGRFINADVLISTGQGVLGNNRFSYCNNTPVAFADLSGYLPFWVAGAIGGGIAGAIIGAASYLINCGINESEVNIGGLLLATGVGALNGALGGAAGVLDTIAKPVLAATVGVVSCVYTAATTDGSFGEKVTAGLAAGGIAAGSTMLGFKIDTTDASLAGTAIATYAATMTVAVPAELLNIGVQLSIDSFLSEQTSTSSVPQATPPQSRTRRPRNYVTCVEGFV